MNNIIAEGNPEIIKKIWERYATGVNPLSAIKYVLESDYNTSFEFCWTDFCARNYFNSMYQNMDNDIYYHIDQKDIVPIQTLDLSLSNPLIIFFRNIFLKRLGEKVEKLKTTNSKIIQYAYENQLGIKKIHKCCLEPIETKDVDALLRFLCLKAKEILQVDVRLKNILRA